MTERFLLSVGMMWHSGRLKVFQVVELLILATLFLRPKEDVIPNVAKRNEESK